MELFECFHTTIVVLVNLKTDDDVDVGVANNLTFPPETSVLKVANVDPVFSVAYSVPYESVPS